MIGIDKPKNKLSDLEKLENYPKLPDNFLSKEINYLLSEIQKNDKNNELEFLFKDLEENELNSDVYIKFFDSKASPFFINEIEFMNNAQKLKLQIDKNKNIRMCN